MANVNIKYECGCGQRFTEPQSAIMHSSITGHILTIHGSVTPSPIELTNAKIYRASEK